MATHPRTLPDDRPDPPTQQSLLSPLSSHTTAGRSDRQTPRNQANPKGGRHPQSPRPDLPDATKPSQRRPESLIRAHRRGSPRRASRQRRAADQGGRTTVETGTTRGQHPCIGSHGKHPLTRTDEFSAGSGSTHQIWELGQLGSRVRPGRNCWLAQPSSYGVKKATSIPVWLISHCPSTLRYSSR